MQKLRFPIREEKSEVPNKEVQQYDVKITEPKSIVDFLDKYVVGQNAAKETLAVSFSNWIIRRDTEDDTLPKQNVILIGPSGVGKTYLVSLLAKIADVPIAKTSASGHSAEGFVGSNLSSLFKQIRAKRRGNAPYAMVFIDELDKIARENPGGGFDNDLQDELLPWLEESEVMIDGRESIRTKNLFWIAAGAFSGVTKEDSLQGIIRKRLGLCRDKIGFRTKSKNRETDEENYDEEYILDNVAPEDLIEYGLKPELVGRLSTTAILDPLCTRDMIRILVDSENNPLRRYCRLLNAKGYAVEVSARVPKIIAENCPEETGARALESICSKLFNCIVFDPEAFAKENVIKLTPKLVEDIIYNYR